VLGAVLYRLDIVTLKELLGPTDDVAVSQPSWFDLPYSQSIMQLVTCRM